ncbi:MAG: Gldg family protein [Phycisphaerales bacterium]|nr:Gldg family protein [Phycisphaerales bacterium]
MTGRSATWSTILYVAGVIVAAVALVVLAHLPEIRVRIDATKSRAYSLSPQTMELLDHLEGEWTLAVILVESQADPATVRQVDEVLSRFSASNESLRVLRIDPTRPESLRIYESLLIDLQDRYREEIEAYTVAIEEATGEFRGLIRFAGEMAGQLRVLAESSSQELSRNLTPRIGALSLLAGQGSLVLEEVEDALGIEESRPLPNHARAVSILAQGLSQWAEELDDAARLLDDEDSIEAARLGEDCIVEARRLAIAADRLVRLPRMELSRIGGLLQSGDAAIVLGPEQAAVIPAGQLFAGMVSGTEERVSFDRRFRGEQLLSSAIRSLDEGIDPTVIFVHDRDVSMLKSDSQNIDVTGAQSMLEASRVNVMEWSVSTEKRPVIPPGSPAVWIVMAPARRTGLKPSRSEMELVHVAGNLLADGEPVLLSFYPSLLPRYGQSDPWAELVRPLGIEVKTGQVITESNRGPDGEHVVGRVQVLTEFTEPHLVAAALHGQSLALPLPVPVGISEDARRGDILLMAHVSPRSTRWLEEDWSPRDEAMPMQADQTSLDQPAPVIAAVERPSPVGGEPQRVLVVGSGGWMLNYVADMVMATGGERYALLYPGNHELLLSGSAWLAGLDDRIAPGPLSQEVARLGSIPSATRRQWSWFLLLGIPGVITLVGIGVWFRRRS